MQTKTQAVQEKLHNQYNMEVTTLTKQKIKIPKFSVDLK